MSQIIDTRVVELSFDNKDFEKNVSTSIKTLDKFEEKVEDLSGAKSGLENLQQGLNGLDFDKINRAADTITKRFSLFGEIWSKTIGNITTKVEGLFSSLASQAKAGGMTRSLNLEQAKSTMKGLSLDVDAMMKNVNDAVDGTAYSLDAAAKVAAQLGASGLNAGEQMYDILRTIAGVASASGRDYENIGNIFTTIASNGKLMTMQLRQFSYAGLNVSAALAKHFGVTERAIGEMTTKGQISFDEFVVAMKENYAELAGANDTYTGALANLRSALNRIGQGFTDPWIVEARDIFNDLRLVLNDIKKTMEPVYKRYSEILSMASKSLRSLIKDPSTARVYVSIINNILNIFEGILSIIGSLGEGFRKAFGRSFISSIADILEKFELFTSKLILTETASKDLSNVFSGIFSILRIGGQILSGITRAITPYSGILNTILGILLHYVGVVGELLTKLADSEIITKGITGALNLLGTAILTVIAIVVRAVGYVATLLKDSGLLESAIRGIATAILYAIKYGQMAVDWVKGLVSKVILFISNFKTQMSDVQQTTSGAATSINTIAIAFTWLKEVLSNVTSFILAHKWIIAVAIALGALVTMVVLVISIMSRMNEILKNFDIAFKEFHEIENLSPVQEAAKGFIDAINAIKDTVNAFLKMAGVGILIYAIGNVIKAITDFAQLPWDKAVQGVVAVVAILAASAGVLKYVSKLETDAKSLISAAVLVASFSLLARSLAALVETGPSIEEAVSTFVIMLSAVGMLYSVMQIVDSIGHLGDVATALGTIAAFSVILQYLLAPALQAFAGLDIESAIGGMVAAAIAIGALVAAANVISANLESIVGLLTVLGALAGVSLILKFLFVPAMQAMAGIDYGEVVKGLGAFLAVIVVFGVLAGILTAVPVAILGVAVALIALVGIAAAMYIFAGAMNLMAEAQIKFAQAKQMSVQAIREIAQVLVELGQVPLTTILSGVLGLGAAFVVMALGGLMLTPVAPTLLMVGAALYFLGPGLEYAASAFTGFAEVVINIVDAVVQKLSELVQAGADAVSGLVNGIEGAVGGAVKAGADLGSKVLSGFRLTSGWGSDWSTMLAAGFDAVHGLFTGVNDNLDLANLAGSILGEETVNGLKDALSGFDISSFLGIDSLLGMFGGTVKYGSSKKALSGSLHEELAKNAEQAGKTSNALDQLGLNLDEIKDKFGGSGGGGGGGAAKATKEYNKQLDESITFFDLASEEIQAFNKHFSDAMGAVAEDEALAYSTLAVESFAETLLAANDDIQEFEEQADGSMERVMTHAQALYKALEEYKNKLKDAIKIDPFSKFDKKSDEERMKGKDLMENIKSQIDAVKEWRANLVKLRQEGLSQEVVDALAMEGTSSFEKVRAFMDMTADELKQYNDLYSESLGLSEETANLLISEFAQAGMDTSQGYADGIDPEPAIAKITEMGQAVLDGLRTVLESHSPSEAMKRIGGDTDEGLKLGIEEGTLFVVSQAMAMASKVYREVKRLLAKDRFHQLGVDICEGVRQGIMEKAEEVANAAAEMAASALQAAKDAVASASPSKKFMELGKNMDEGLAIGLLQYAGLVTSASEQMANDSINTVNDAISRVIDSTNEYVENLNPIISPFLDLTDVERGASAISAMMNRQNAVRLGAIYGTGNTVNDINGLGDTYNVTINAPTTDARDLAREFERLIVRR